MCREIVLEVRDVVEYIKQVQFDEQEKIRIDQEKEAQEALKKAQELAENPQGELNRTNDNVVEAVVVEREPLIFVPNLESALEYIKTKHKLCQQILFSIEYPMPVYEKLTTNIVIELESQKTL